MSRKNLRPLDAGVHDLARGLCGRCRPLLQTLNLLLVESRVLLAVLLFHIVLVAGSLRRDVRHGLGQGLVGGLLLEGEGLVGATGHGIGGAGTLVLLVQEFTLAVDCRLHIGTARVVLRHLDIVPLLVLVPLLLQHVFGLSVELAGLDSTIERTADGSGQTDATLDDTCDLIRTHNDCLLLQTKKTNPVSWIGLSFPTNYWKLL